MIFDTKELKKLVVKHSPLMSIGIMYDSPMADYTTKTLILTYGLETVHIVGFSSQEHLKKDDVVKVEMLEIQSIPGDSAGGIQIKDTKFGAFMGALCADLRTQGWTIVPTLDPYF